MSVCTLHELIIPTVFWHSSSHAFLSHLQKELRRASNRSALMHQDGIFANSQQEHNRTTVLPSNVLLGKTALRREVEQERESTVNLLRSNTSFNAKTWLP